MAIFDFHEGEIKVQSNIGVREKAEGLKQMVKPQLKPGMAEFIADRMEVFVSSKDSSGNVWASVVFGRPGFIDSDSSGSSITVHDGVNTWDPLHENAAYHHSPLGFLFIELATRRRNRVNGVSIPKHAPYSGLHMEVKESFGNCPKYIQKRVAMPSSSFSFAKNSELRPPYKNRMNQSQIDLVSNADFLTIATAASNDRGADVSHRGGRPGFVRVSSNNELWFPDYSGNNLFQTLGNIMTNPNTGLLFIDWKQKRTLQLSGKAYVIFSDELDQLGLNDQFEPHKCAIKFCIEFVLDTPEAVPFEYKLVEYSPHAPKVQHSPSLLSETTQKQSQEGDAVPSVQDFYAGPVEVVEIQDVARGVKDFKLQAPVNIEHKPGQYAAFDLIIPTADGKSITTNRNWTISSVPTLDDRGAFHITVKHKVGGLASTWLHEYVNLGQILHLAGVDGDFSCFQESPTSLPDKILFLSAGVGITPMLSMLRGIKAFLSSSKQQKTVDIVFWHSARTQEDIPFIAELSSRAWTVPNSKIQFISNLTLPDPAISFHEDDHKILVGRLNQSMLQGNIQDVQERKVYLCGPDSYMEDLEVILLQMGVSAGSVFKESFIY